MNLYRVNERRTLGGETAGEDVPGSGYLAFLPGELVVVYNIYEDGVVDAVRLSDGVAQGLDLSSLTELGVGLYLTAPDLLWVNGLTAPDLLGVNGR